MPQVKRLLFCGCGFLASHIISALLPFASQIILLDDDRVEQGNYDNSLFPKNATGRYKVSALASHIQLLSSVPVTPLPIHIKSVKDLQTIHAQYHPDFVFITFDNIEARQWAQEYARNQIPALSVGVTENYLYIDWVESVILPQTPEQIQQVQTELHHIRDVCTRLEFRGLGILAAALTYDAFYRWLEKGQKVAYLASTKNGVATSVLRR